MIESDVGALIFLGVTSAIIAYLIHWLMEKYRITLDKPIKFEFTPSEILFWILILVAGGVPMSLMGLLFKALGIL